MIINNNISALNTYRQMGANQGANAKSMEKLSSGLRINRAGDDAAGLAISEKMRAQVRGLDQASRNSQDGISMIQTAEGALQETHNILQRMRELATQAGNDTNVEVDREEIQKEMNQLTSEINRIGNTTEFNTQKILNGGMDTTGGEKITEATSAEITTTGTFSDAGATAGTIKVDGRTFDLANMTAIETGDDEDDAISKLKDLTSGGVKLSELVDIENDGGQIKITAKSEGSTSTIEIGATTTIGGLALDAGEVKGDPTTIEKVGMQGADALSGDLAELTSSNNTISVKIGTDDFADVDVKQIDVKLEEGKAYDLDTDKGRAELIKDINAGLQKAGLDGQLTASLSKDNELQLISQTGKDFAVDTTSSFLAALDTASGGNAGDLSGGIENVEQVVGAGAQGSGFNAKFQIGANQGQSINLNINDMRAAALGITGNAGQQGFTATNSVTNGTNDVKAEAALDVSTHENASAAITTINDAIEKVSAERSSLGAIQNRLEHTISNLGNASENLSAAESRIRDVDMAKEVMEMTRTNILSQASQAMLAQANQKPQSVLQLLG
ncbi:flagellin [Bacillus mesophilum]|uniref:Flagellin n=1 Tax=Bacillus mesophilum TaxID=1071718 RepID=A0A7V7UV25_9BACI|nr:flagellin [Bacillus mesophilum]KAB2332672.1 flagellin [Bacillus mesophilum]